MITYITAHITLEQLCQEMRDICRFASEQVFTMKWVDEEGNLSLKNVVYYNSFFKFALLKFVTSLFE